jgi:hypothetical protein
MWLTPIEWRHGNVDTAIDNVIFYSKKCIE